MRLASVARFLLPCLSACLTAPAWAASSPRPSADRCPRAARVELNLAAWKAALKRADTDKRRDEVLMELKLTLADGRPDPGEAADASEDEGRAAPTAGATLLGLDDALVRLGSDERPDHVIQVRYRVGSSDDRAVAYLVQVLRPLDGAAWCLLGAALSRLPDQTRALQSYVIDFVPLLSASAKAIEVQRVDAELRHGETHRQYWIADGFKLRKIFDEPLSSMTTGEAGTTTAKVARLTLTGGFPRRIELTHATKQVTKQAGCEVRSGDLPCDDSTSSTTTTFVYDGRQYVRRSP